MFGWTASAYGDPIVESRLDLALANDLQEVSRVIDCVEGFGAGHGVAPQQSLRFGLALDELITNILSHGLAGRADAVITLTVTHDNGSLYAELADNGPPFDPLAADVTPRAGTIEDREVGGLGLAIVKSVLDRIDYRREDGFNRLKLEMKLEVA